ncbi:MAG TPA: ABC transporter ATP-binding protein [Nitriliruptoraceae bacterium]|nr:ABC transporter ATP-binding protein [Nitriliruptoraceae bacterium]
MQLELQGITKRFPGVIANDHVDLVVRDGEIHGLLGENGAGKSTLMNILYGLYSADEGTILIDGEPVHFDGPGDAIDAGIGMVHQHFMLVPVFTVAENVTLGTEFAHVGGRLDRQAANDAVRDLSRKHNLPLEPDVLVEDLPVGLQQRAEILKALYREAKLLILDEPTAVLTPQEADDLFEAMAKLRDDGRSLVFISHKLREHRAIADRISILRRGKIVGTADPRTASDEELAELMVGRPVDLVVDKPQSSPGEVVLDLDDVDIADEDGVDVVQGITLQVRRGEIVAVAGVEGNGQTEFVNAVTGLHPIHDGRMLLLGDDLSDHSRVELLRGGIGHVPQDRNNEGLVGRMSIAENLVLDHWNSEPYAQRGLMQFRLIREHADHAIEAYDIRTPGADTLVGSLSGGNQQKVVVAREFDKDNALLVAAQPTRGVDVGSIEYIHKRIVEERDEGTAVLIVSSELDEVLALADRVAVMFHGHLVGPFDMPVDKGDIGRMMAGATPEEVFGPSGVPNPGAGGDQDAGERARRADAPRRGDGEVEA